MPDRPRRPASGRDPVTTRQEIVPSPMTVHILDPEVHMYDVPGHTLTEAATVIASMAEAGKAEWWPQFSTRATTASCHPSP